MQGCRVGVENLLGTLAIKSDKCKRKSVSRFFFSFCIKYSFIPVHSIKCTVRDEKTDNVIKVSYSLATMNADHTLRYFSN